MKIFKQILLYCVVGIVALAASFFVRTQLINSEQPALSSEASRQGAKAILAAILPDIAGNNQAISQWKGDVLVVNFWATWCAPCREEIPEFIETQEKYRDQGLRFIGIAIDRKEKVIAYSKEFGINYPVLIGSMGAMSLAIPAGNVSSSLPFTVVINRSGAISKTYLGRVNQEKLEKTLLPLLQDKSQPNQQEHAQIHDVLLTPFTL